MISFLRSLRSIFLAVSDAAMASTVLDYDADTVQDPEADSAVSPPGQPRPSDQDDEGQLFWTDMNDQAVDQDPPPPPPQDDPKPRVRTRDQMEADENPHGENDDDDEEPRPSKQPVLDPAEPIDCGSVVLHPWTPPRVEVLDDENPSTGAAMGYNVRKLPALVQCPR